MSLKQVREKLFEAVEAMDKVPVEQLYPKVGAERFEVFDKFTPSAIEVVEHLKSNGRTARLSQVSTVNVGLAIGMLESEGVIQVECLDGDYQLTLTEGGLIIYDNWCKLCQIVEIVTREYFPNYC